MANKNDDSWSADAGDNGELTTVSAYQACLMQTRQCSSELAKVILNAVQENSNSYNINWQGKVIPDDVSLVNESDA